MRYSSHLRLYIYGTIAWAIFWLMGLPRYYLQYSNTVMIWFDVLILLPLVVIFVRVLKKVRSGRRLKLSLWMAFYFTVPLAFYDWLYCGLLLGHGFSFVVKYWFLSVYYIIPWLVIPACALVLNSRRSIESVPSK